ncbi:MAG: hypothetical protein WCB18_04075 [Thermoplasmata archaeon]
MVRNQGRVTRFVVMAMLQAARAKTLGLPEESAFSWGLNRAIFIAAAKAGFRGGGSTEGPSSAGATAPPKRETYRLGDDEAFRDPKSKQLVFTIGEKDQTLAEFERAVVARFGTKENFRAAWDEALRTVGQYDRATLESRERFYSEVYKPRRDDLSDTWTQKYSPTPKSKR